MCNERNCSHDNMDDALDNLFGGPVNDVADATTFAMSALSNATHDRGAKIKTTETFEEKCPSCRGSAVFRGYSGRVVGDCFKCKGKGKLTFRTSPDVRAKTAESRMAKADRERIELQQRKIEWIRDNADAFAWMRAKEESFDFAHAMVEAFNRYGYLTEKQLQAVLRCVARDIERAETRKVEAAARIANAPAVDVARIEQAFAHAQAKGVKRPKMRLGEYKFSLAPATGRNAGALYVTRPSDDQYLGKIIGGKFTKVRECSDAAEAEIVALANDPHAASIAYGQRTGVCGICGRELTNHASIDLGIGPVCKEKFGWA